MTGIWWCVVDGQGYIHSVWGNSLETDARMRAESIMKNSGWAGIHVVKVAGEKPAIGANVKKTKTRGR